MAQDVADFSRRQPDIQRVEDRPRLEHAEVGLEQLMAVVAHEAHPIARLDADGAQRVGEPMRALGVLPVGESLFAVDDGVDVSEEGRRAIAELEDAEGDAHDRMLRPATRKALPILAANGRLARSARALSAPARAGEERFPISLGEGSTPLVRTHRLGAELGLEELYLKYEGTNPTGSFKDRGMVLAVNRAVAGGAHAVVCASTGNTAASAAA